MRRRRCLLVPVLDESVACFTQRSVDGHAGELIGGEVEPEHAIVTDTHHIRPAAIEPSGAPPCSKTSTNVWVLPSRIAVLDIVGL